MGFTVTVEFQSVTTDRTQYTMLRWYDTPLVSCKILSLVLIFRHFFLPRLAVNLLAGFVCEDPMLSSTISRVIETQPSANTNTSYSNENVSPNRKTSYSADDKTPNGMASYDIEYSSAANSKSSYNVKYSSPANSMASSFSEEYYQPRTSPGFGTKHNVLYEDFLRDDQHKWWKMYYISVILQFLNYLQDILLF